MTEYSIPEFAKLFTEEYCNKYLEAIRFPSGVACIWCGSCHVYQLTPRNKNGTLFYKCGDKHCHRKFSLTSHTIFDNSGVSLSNWFFLIYFNAANKKNTSSVQIAKYLGVHQKTSWGMQNNLRYRLGQEDILLEGIVEIDEAFHSRWSKLGKWGGKIVTRKNPILGMIERGGRVVLKMVPNRKRENILPLIYKFVKPGSVVYTDGFQGYRILREDYFHNCVEHSMGEYVRDQVHTNTIENVWSFFKKNVRNAHHAISVKHLQSYLDEAAFKFNNRDKTAMERFEMILKRCL